MEVFVYGLIDVVNGVLWNYVLIVLLFGVGVWFMLWFWMIQLKVLFFSMKLVGSKGELGSILLFQVFVIGFVSCVGIGNIVGVVVVLMVGGLGVIFWMWMIVLVGMLFVFVEVMFVQIFKVLYLDGSYCGGFVYYIQMGLCLCGFGVLFLLLLIFVFGFVFNVVQVNVIVDVFYMLFGWCCEMVGFGFVLLFVLIIFGGICCIVMVVQVIVLLMVIGYFVFVVYVVVMYIMLVFGVIVLIVKSVFGFEQVVGGLIGYVVSQVIVIGVKCGLFLNEVGMGSVLNVVVIVSMCYFVMQGLIQMFGVFVDMIVICSVIVFVILLLGQYEFGIGMEGVVFMQCVILSYVGDWGGVFIWLL